MKVIRWIAFSLLVLISVGAFCACGTLDKTELEEVLNREFDPAGYTDASYQAYLKCYQEALDVYQSKNTTAYRIESVTVNLLEAIDDLVPVADFTQLKLELAEQINPMLYTNASYQVYKTVYDSAVIVASNELSKQSVVNNAVRNLRTAKSALVPKTDTSALAALLETDYPESQYTVTSYSHYASAAEAARALLYDDGASESDVRLAANGLRQAIARLIPLGDATQLQNLLDLTRKQYLENATGDILPEQRYTQSTLNALKGEYQHAINCIQGRDTSQEDIDLLYSRVSAAVNQLVDKSALYEAICRMDSYLPLQEKYTQASFDGYLFAVTKAMRVNEESNPSVQQIVDAVNELILAEAALVRRPLDASGSVDFYLSSMWIICYDCSIQLGDYFRDYSPFYNQVFESTAMIEQSGGATFRLRDGYSVSILSDILSFTDVGRDGKDRQVSVLGVGFDMDEYSVGELLGAPTEFTSTSKSAVLAYVDGSAGIRVEFSFTHGKMDSIMITRQI